MLEKWERRFLDRRVLGKAGEMIRRGLGKIFGDNTTPVQYLMTKSRLKGTNGCQSLSKS